MKTAHVITSVLKMHPSQAALDSVVILRRHAAGAATVADVLAALAQLEHIYGPGIKSAAALYRRSLHAGDPAARREIRYEALTHIIQWIFREQVKAGVWENILKVCRTVRKKAGAALSGTMQPRPYARLTA